MARICQIGRRFREGPDRQTRCVGFRAGPSGKVMGGQESGKHPADLWIARSRESRRDIGALTLPRAHEDRGVSRPGFSADQAHHQMGALSVHGSLELRVGQVGVNRRRSSPVVVLHLDRHPSVFQHEPEFLLPSAGIGRKRQAGISPAGGSLPDRGGGAGGQPLGSVLVSQDDVGWGGRHADHPSTVDGDLISVASHIGDRPTGRSYAPYEYRRSVRTMMREPKFPVRGVEPRPGGVIVGSLGSNRRNGLMRGWFEGLVNVRQRHGLTGDERAPSVIAQPQRDAETRCLWTEVASRFVVGVVGF